MTGMSIAATALAVAVLLRPGSAAVTARLAGLRIRADQDQEPGQPANRADQRPGRSGPPPGRSGPQAGHSGEASGSGRLSSRLGRSLGCFGLLPGWPGLSPPEGPVGPARRLPLMPMLAAAGTALLPIALGGGIGGLVMGIGMGGAAFVGGKWLLRNGKQPPPDPLRLASCWDLLAACLRGGLPVPVAVRAVADDLPAPADIALDHTAELLALGADPVSAWAPALAEPLTAELARGARRSARSGAALASVAEGIATSVRAGADDLAEAKAQRAAVAVTGPLGLCFLPAFLCIGVVPVVIGLATRLMASW